ncbi:sulfurtransferase TusA family protein [Photobacterium lipolyticum]|uniref:Sulfurtransferase TusA family protein n=1 Tax=Photobacterium lipolyticum TaxID=266810 RepID=A0A2T3MVL1_9GAMM|nr:sulfurtransferase TusA family protein [Photobacterium lipolyticum]PSW03994.1 sulfurtransferase TusA family protein [Photobacterium lipolyticum]
MEIQSLDLTSERCPMALLLAKRVSKGLRFDQILQIHISDPGGRQDIPRYLLNHGFNVEVQADSYQKLVIVVTKRL